MEIIAYDEYWKVITRALITENLYKITVENYFNNPKVNSIAVKRHDTTAFYYFLSDALRGG